jgi:hypothetical protein
MLDVSGVGVLSPGRCHRASVTLSAARSVILMAAQRPEDLLFSSDFSVESVTSVESVSQIHRALFGERPLGMPLGLMGLRIQRTNRIRRSLLDNTPTARGVGASLNSSHPSNGRPEVLDRYSAQTQPPLGTPR